MAEAVHFILSAKVGKGMHVQTVGIHVIVRRIIDVAAAAAAVPIAIIYRGTNNGTDVIVHISLTGKSTAVRIATLRHYRARAWTQVGNRQVRFVRDLLYVDVVDGACTHTRDRSRVLLEGLGASARARQDRAGRIRGTVVDDGEGALVVVFIVVIGAVPQQRLVKLTGWWRRCVRVVPPNKVAFWFVAALL